MKMDPTGDVRMKYKLAQIMEITLTLTDPGTTVHSPGFVAMSRAGRESTNCVKPARAEY
jgi:hypothetical protein